MATAKDPVKVVKIEDVVAAINDVQSLGKNWWKSKTLWGAVVTVIASVPVILGYLSMEQAIGLEGALLAALIAFLRLGNDTPLQ